VRAAGLRGWPRFEQKHTPPRLSASQPGAHARRPPGRVLQDLHLQGAQAGPPGHGHQLQGHVHHVRSRRPPRLPRPR
jgi:hypothetical protein